MKPIYTTIKVTDKTQTVKLPLFQQIQLLFGKISMDENIALESSEKISRSNLELQSALSNLINMATNKMKEKGKQSVTLSISSRFKPYFEEILSDSMGKGRFYDFVIEDKGSPIIGGDYFINMTISEKEI